MNALLAKLNERERWLVIVGGLCFLLYLFYLFLYEPMSSRLVQNTSLLQEKIDTLSFLQKAQGQYQSSKTKKTVDNNKLLTVVSTQLKQDGWHFPHQLQQTASGEIQLNFEQVPFVVFMGWLYKLNEEYAILVKSLHVEPFGKPGITKVSLVLSASK